jgi:hypothetical protein
MPRPSTNDAMIDEPSHITCPGPRLLLRQPHANKILSQHASARISARSQAIAINIRLPAMWARLDKVGRALASHSTPHPCAPAHGSALHTLGHKQTHRRKEILTRTWDTRPTAQHRPLHPGPTQLTVMLDASFAALSGLLANASISTQGPHWQATSHNETTPFKRGLAAPSKQVNRTQHMNQTPAGP